MKRRRQTLLLVGLAVAVFALGWVFVGLKVEPLAPKLRAPGPAENAGADLRASGCPQGTLPDRDVCIPVPQP